MIRKPAVAGTFYESDPDSLKMQIEWCFKHQLGPGGIPGTIGSKGQLKGVIVPHAGYMYSGPIAAHSYAEIALDGFPETFVILCPNHTGMGSGVSTTADSKWETPLGQVEVDIEFRDELLRQTSIIDMESSAHIQEHSCEVQIPFLQYLSHNSGAKFKIVPICLWMQDLKTAAEIGNAMAKVSGKLSRKMIAIASTDFTHYKPYNIAYQTDKQVLEAIESLDEKMMMQRVSDLNVTMCGYGPVAATLVYVKKMGARKAEVLKYATSGDITGDHSAVVGYASAIFL